MSRKNATCRSWSLVGLAMIGLLLQTSTTQTRQGDTYTWTTIDPPGATLATAAAISSNGYIAGRWDGPDGRRRGYLLANGTYFTIEPPGATFTNANGVNPRGEISECTSTASESSTAGFSEMGSSRTSTCPEQLRREGAS